MLFNNVNTPATCFDFEDAEINEQADLTPETQGKSPEENAAEKMGNSLEAAKNHVSGYT